MPAIAVAVSYDLLAVPLPDESRQWQRAWRHFTLAKKANVRESQLRGSGGFSPRFPNIPWRNKVKVAQLAKT